MSKKRKNIDFGSQSVYYEKYYDIVNVRGNGIGARTFQKLHRAMEKPYNTGYFGKVLEIGAGSGEHLDFIKHGYDQYFITDIRPPILTTAGKQIPKLFVW